MTDIPSSATITEARLYLYQTDSHGDSVYNNSVHKIIGREPIIDQVSGYNAYNGNPWTPVPAGTTNNDAPLGLADIAPDESTIQLGTLQQYHSWPVTDMVQEWVNNPSSNYGLLIQGEPASIETGRTFAASENQNTATRPKLVISYSILLPVPQILSIEVTQ
ncbi:MAG: DNRLRE domain-containing protein [Desulfobulbaceae bacterium]|nr:DNRLRE domain-containing protein [Desulfobulbaceae bacterium]